MARLKGGMGVAPSAAWGRNLGMSRAWGLLKLGPNRPHGLNARVFRFASLDLLQRGEWNAHLLGKYDQFRS